MSEITVEIGQYREINKGAFKATFSLLIHEPHMQKILECKYFSQGDAEWWSMPAKEIKYTDGRKTQYFPYNSFGDKTYDAALKEAVLKALRKESFQKSASKPPVSFDDSDENPF